MVAEMVFGLALTKVCETTGMEFLFSLKLHRNQYVIAMTGEPALLNTYKPVYNGEIKI